MSLAARDYIRSTLRAIAPSLDARTVFRDVDRTGHSREPLEEAHGQTRAFEVVSSSDGPRKVPLGNVDPRAWDEDVIVRVRYDAAGHHDRARVLDQLRSDQIQITRALYTGGWAAVSGLAVLNARPGGIEAFGAAAVGAGAEEKIGGYLAEVVVSISYDV